MGRACCSIRRPGDAPGILADAGRWGAIRPAHIPGSKLLRMLKKARMPDVIESVLLPKIGAIAPHVSPRKHYTLAGAAARAHRRYDFRAPRARSVEEAIWILISRAPR